MSVAEAVIGEGLLNSLLDQIGGLAKPLTTQLVDDLFRLLGGSLAAFLSMDRLQHVRDFADFRLRYMTEDISIKMDVQVLPTSAGLILRHALDQASADIRDD